MTAKGPRYEDVIDPWTGEVLHVRRYYCRDCSMTLNFPTNIRRRLCPGCADARKAQRS